MRQLLHRCIVPTVLLGLGLPLLAGGEATPPATPASTPTAPGSQIEAARPWLDRALAASTQLRDPAARADAEALITRAVVALGDAALATKTIAQFTGAAAQVRAWLLVAELNATWQAAAVEAAVPLVPQVGADQRADLAAQVAVLQARTGDTTSAEVLIAQQVADASAAQRARAQVAAALAGQGKVDAAKIMAKAGAEGDVVRSAIATALITAKQFAAASTLAADITDEALRGATQAEVARAQAANGDVPGAQTAVLAITQAAARNQALVSIAAAQRAAAKLGPAADTLRGVAPSPGRDAELLLLVQAHLAAQPPAADAAEAVNLLIADPAVQAQGWHRIADALARGGKADAAATKVAMVADPLQSVQALCAIAAQCIAAGDSTTAQGFLSTARTMADKQIRSRERPLALAMVAEGLAKAGAVANAKLLLGELGKAPEAFSARIALGIALANAGDAGGARAQSMQISDPSGRDRIAAALATAQAAAGDFAAAVETAESIGDVAQHGAVLWRIAFAQAKSGRSPTWIYGLKLSSYEVQACTGTIAGLLVVSTQ